MALVKLRARSVISDGDDADNLSVQWINWVVKVWRDARHWRASRRPVNVVNLTVAYNLVCIQYNLSV